MARSVKLEIATALHLKNIHGFLKRKVTCFGNGAKVDCPKEYLDYDVYLVILNDNSET